VRAEALRDNALAPERAGVLEDRRALAGEMLIEGDPIRNAAEEIGEHRLALLKRSPSEVRAV
jgi:hypothetical protein